MPQGTISNQQLDETDPVSAGYQTLVDAASQYLGADGLARRTAPLNLDATPMQGKDAIAVFPILPIP